MLPTGKALTYVGIPYDVTTVSSKGEKEAGEGRGYGSFQEGRKKIWGLPGVFFAIVHWSFYVA